MIMDRILAVCLSPVGFGTFGQMIMNMPGNKIGN